MKIFKLFLKHVFNSPMVIIANLILMFAIMIPSYAPYQELVKASYQPHTFNIGIINNDPDNPVSEHLIEFIDSQAEIKMLDGENPEEEADLLYQRELDYVLTIPNNYGNNLLGSTKDSLPTLEKNYSSNLSSVMVIDNLLNNYVMNFQVASLSLKDSNDPQDVDKMLNHLSQTLNNEVEILASETSSNVLTIYYGDMFLPIACYIFIVVLVQLYTIPMLEGRQQAIAMREAMSSISNQNKLFQYLLASTVIGFILWLVVLGLGIFIVGFENMTTQTGLMLTLASFCTLIGIQGMAFFIASIVPNKNAMSFVQTVLGLLIAFGSGIFVPRMFISEIYQTLVSIASPIWFVKTKEVLLDTQIISQSVMNQYWQYIGIMLLIGLAYYTISFFLFKYRSSNYNY